MYVGFTQYSADSSKFKDPHGTIPVFDIGARLGVLEKVDLGLKYTIPGAMTGDVKYMFTDRKSKLGFSTGLKAANMNIELEITSGDSVTSTAKTPKIIDVILPLNVSYYPGNGWPLPCRRTPPTVP